MKESYGKEPATPTGPESCGAARKGVAEALTEERAVATSTLRSGVNPDRTNRQQNPVHNNGAKTSPRVSLTRDNSSDRAWGTYRNGLRDDCRVASRKSRVCSVSACGSGYTCKVSVRATHLFCGSSL